MFLILPIRCCNPCAHACIWYYVLMSNQDSKPRTEGFELSPIELACGVSLDAVKHARSRAMVHLTSAGARVVVDSGPALGGAVARMALGVRCEYLGLNGAGYAVYGPAESVM